MSSTNERMNPSNTVVVFHPLFTYSNLKFEFQSSLSGSFSGLARGMISVGLSEMPVAPTHAMSVICSSLLGTRTIPPLESSLTTTFSFRALRSTPISSTLKCRIFGTSSVAGSQTKSRQWAMTFVNVFPWRISSTLKPLAVLSVRLWQKATNHPLEGGRKLP